MSDPSDRAMASAADPRFEKGLDILRRTTGGAGEAIVRSLDDIAPDLGRFVIEFAAGDVLSRGALDLKSRQLATVAALTALGTAQPQLKAQIAGALNVGWTQGELVEVITQMAVYAGFPAALNGIAVAREAFADRGAQPGSTIATKRPVDVVRAMIERFQAKDVPGALAYFDENVAVHLPPALPYAGVYHGHAGFTDYMGRLRAAWDRFEITVEQMFESSSSVLVRERLDYTPKGGEPATMPLILTFEVPAGLITRQEIFYWSPEAAQEWK